MSLIPSRSAAAIAAAILGFSLTVGLSQNPVVAQGANGQSRMEEAFKNIKSFRGLPADQMMPTMVYFEAALGVGCAYCHDADAAKRDLDTNPRKDVARQMIEMVKTLNKNSFNGERDVTCFTCHSGRATPIGMPNVTGHPWPAALGADYLASLPPVPPVPPISASQVLDKYFAAFGGASAVQKVPSLTAVGTVAQRRPGRDYPSNQIEISSKASGMQLVVTRAGQNENLTAVSSDGGWAKAGSGAPRDLSNAEYDGMKLEDAFNLPAQLKQMLLDPQVRPPEVIKGREVYVMTGHTKYLPEVTAYFDKDSGMLARLVYLTETPVGPYPTQIEYGDFRDVGGRKVPFTWVISQTRNREFTWAMQQVRAAAVDDAKFARPVASSP